MTKKKQSTEDLTALKLKQAEMAQKSLLLKSEQQVLAEQKDLAQPMLLDAVTRPSYSVENAFPNLTLNKPVGLYHAGDGTNRLFVVEQPGLIRWFANDPSESSAQVFLDIDSIVGSGSERGLLGLAFHPEHSENGYFYVNYTNNSGNTVIARYKVDENNLNQANEDSAFIILEVNQPYSNHNGGQIGFGPDDYLYVSFGDGGSGGDPQVNGQNLQTLLGSIIRIDVDNPSDGLNYSIPVDNPFLGNSDARDEIYAYGLRNTWRFSWDSETELLWGADVGQNAWEEINIIESGLNYGWNTMEGDHCFPPSANCDQNNLELPIWEYSHADGCSITGGFVYRGNEMPSLIGQYIYGDYCTGRIWALDYDDAANSLNNRERHSNYPLVK